MTATGETQQQNPNNRTTTRIERMYTRMYMCMRPGTEDCTRVPVAKTNPRLFREHTQSSILILTTYSFIATTAKFTCERFEARGIRRRRRRHHRGTRWSTWGTCGDVPEEAVLSLETTSPSPVTHLTKRLDCPSDFVVYLPTLIEMREIVHVQVRRRNRHVVTAVPHVSHVSSHTSLARSSYPLLSSVGWPVW